MSTNVTGATPTPLETPISGGNDNTQGGNSGEGEQQHRGKTPERGSGNRRSLSAESGEGRNRTLGNVPVSITALAAYNKPIKDFHGS